MSNQSGNRNHSSSDEHYSSDLDLSQPQNPSDERGVIEDLDSLSWRSQSQPPRSFRSRMAISSSNNFRRKFPLRHTVSSSSSSSGLSHQPSREIINHGILRSISVDLTQESNSLRPTLPRIASNLVLNERIANSAEQSTQQPSTKHLPVPEPESDHYLFGEEPPVTEIFRSAEHTKKAFAELQDLKCNQLFCDVILKCSSDESLKIPAHRNVLAACSQYFRAMFTSQMAETRSPVICLGGEINTAALNEIINFMYTSELLISEENVQNLLPIANLFEMNCVKDACCEFLQSRLNPRNCLGIQRFADIHSCTDLLNYSKRFTEKHFGEVLQHAEEFLNLTVNQLVELISSDSLSVSEELVFEAVRRWLEHDPSSRREASAHLFGRVRFVQLPRDYLIQLSESSDFLELHPCCKDFVIEALRYHLLPWDQKRLLNASERMKPRTSAGSPKTLILIGGQSPKAVRTVQCYDFITDTWKYYWNNFFVDMQTSSGMSLSTSLSNLTNRKPDILSVQAHNNSTLVPDMPSRRCRCGVAVVEGLVYVVGGFNGALRLRSTEIYDISRGIWQSGPNMETRRATLGVATINGLIYAIGGFDGTSGFNSCEVLDPGVGIWRSISSMNFRRSSVNVGVLNEKIYAVGGFDGISRRSLSSVERYDPINDSWTILPDMSTRRSGPSVAVLHGMLYVAGGHDGPRMWTSVEVFNPLTNSWQKIADLNISRRNAGMVAHDGLLYAVGGDDGTENLKTVEIYDPVTDRWTIMNSQMCYGVSYSALTIIEKRLIV